MEITNTTKLHLNKTYYFDADGCPCDTLEEARNSNYDSADITVVRKQNCYFKEFSELAEDQQEEACFIIEQANMDAKPQELMYVVGATNKRILLVSYWTELQRDLANKIYTLVKEKRN